MRNTKTKSLLPWPKVKGLIIAHTTSGTVAEFARNLGYSTGALRGAVEGKCPKVLNRMKAILGDLAA